MPPSFVGMVLAAGFGSRLAPLTDLLPKPLVPVGNRPLLGQILNTLRDEGAERLAINVHFGAERVTRFIEGLPYQVHISQEESILGTAGGVAKVGRSLRVESLVLVNGDIAGQLPVSQLLEQAGPNLSLAVTPRPIGLGTVGFDREGKVVRLRGEVFGVEFASGDYMGLAHLGRECLRAMPERGCLIGDFALPQLRAGGVVRAVAVESSFIDVGSITSYWRANLRCVEQEGASILAADLVIPAHIEVQRSVIGEGVSITGAGAILDCVVWPGAQVEAPLQRSIVLSDGQVIGLRDEDR